MKRLFVLLIIISVTPWAYPQQNSHVLYGNDCCTIQSQEGIANNAITSVEDKGNYSTVVQY